MKETRVSPEGTSGAGGLFRTKPLEAILQDAERPEHQLKRQLGPVQLTLLGIGAIIGAGIFATIGTAAKGDFARPGAGPALMLSFTITAIVCAFTALCYAEFASMIPISGSAYTYAYATLGELIAWIIGWDLIIEYAVGNIGVAISWANYFKTFLARLHIPWLFPDGIKIYDWLSMDYRSAAAKYTVTLPTGEVVNKVFDEAPHLFGYPIVFNALAVGIVVVVTLVLLVGVRESAWFNAVMVTIKILVLTFFIVIGSLYLDTRNWRPFMPPAGWAGVSAGAAVIFFAYIGFDAVSTVAEETRNPQRNLPIGIFASLIVCTIFYIAVAAVFTGLISYNDLQNKDVSEEAEPLTMALDHAQKQATHSPDHATAVEQPADGNAGVGEEGAPGHLNWALVIVAFGSVIAHTAVLLVYQLGQPRIFFSMARDGLLPRAFCRVHPRFRTPHIGTILTGVFVAGIAAFATIDEMVDLTNIGTLFAFVLVCVGIIVLRIKEPNRPRPFRVPSGWPWAIALYAGFAAGSWFLPVSTTTHVVALLVGALAFAACRNHIFPILGVVSCLYLIYFLPPTSWLRFAAWLNIGFVIYVGYGVIHSRLTGREFSPRPAEHDARTATVGLGLAVLGAALLLVMHGFDVGLQAIKRDRAQAIIAGQFSNLMAFSSQGPLHAVPFLEPLAPPRTLGEETRIALGDIFNRDAWLKVESGWKDEMVWFLLLPLALNACILCPIVMLRVLRSKREREALPQRPDPAWNLFGSAGVATAVIAYFILIALYNWPRAV
jgi:APA family basic amino acid/polyamine antiporter